MYIASFRLQALWVMTWAEPHSYIWVKMACMCLAAQHPHLKWLCSLDPIASSFTANIATFFSVNIDSSLSHVAKDVFLLQKTNYDFRNKQLPSLLPEIIPSCAPFFAEALSSSPDIIMVINDLQLIASTPKPFSGFPTNHFSCHLVSKSLLGEGVVQLEALKFYSTECIWTFLEINKHCSQLIWHRNLWCAYTGCTHNSS